MGIIASRAHQECWTAPNLLHPCDTEANTRVRPRASNYPVRPGKKKKRSEQGSSGDKAAYGKNKNVFRSLTA